jgi:hypothetical protein
MNADKDRINAVVHDAYLHTLTLTARADGYALGCPWWHGWALTDSWLAGYQAGFRAASEQLDQLLEARLKDG